MRKNCKPSSEIPFEPPFLHRNIRSPKVTPAARYQRGSHIHINAYGGITLNSLLASQLKPRSRDPLHGVMFLVVVSYCAQLMSGRARMVPTMYVPKRHPN
jgi:hypothetical protein